MQKKELKKMRNLNSNTRGIQKKICKFILSSWKI